MAKHAASVGWSSLRNIVGVLVTPVVHFTAVIQETLVLELAVSTVKK
jgi:hypothetical protein